MSEVAIEVSGLVKRFGAKVAVNRVSFQVEVGQCYGLIGPNGAGKTTTFSVMCGYLYPSDGQVRILGADPTEPGSLKRKVGVLPQDAILPAREKVGPLLTYYARLSGLPEPEREAKTALEKVSLQDTWGLQCQALSHGMAKRISLAQALMGAPPVVLLDEPTAGLDPKIAAQVRQVIQEMKGKQTVVVSSHNLQELEELCDAAAILDHGALVQAGTMAELTSKAAEFRVRIASGTVPLDEVRGLPACVGASMDATNSLIVHFNGKQLAAERMISQTLKLLLSRDVLILGVTLGHKLEDRLLQLT